MNLKFTFVKIFTKISYVNIAINISYVESFLRDYSLTIYRNLDNA